MLFWNYLREIDDSIKINMLLLYRLGLEKQEGCGVVARERRWVTCYNGVTPSKTKEFLKSPCFVRL